MTEEVYLEYHDKVLGYLRKKTGSPFVAEDLCQEVFKKVLIHWDSYDPAKASLSTWIYRITCNTFYDYLRTSHPTAELDENVPEVTENDLSDLTEALSHIDERLRNIILRHYYLGESLKDIAVKMGISYAYVKMLHARALSELKDFLKDE